MKKAMKYVLVFILACETIFAMRCLEGNVGITKKSNIDAGTSVNIEMYNNLRFDECPSEICTCCSYYYNVSDAEHCVSWTSASHDSCIQETPTLNEASYELTTKTCSSDGCNNCFEGVSSATKLVSRLSYQIIFLATCFSSVSLLHW